MRVRLRRPEDRRSLMPVFRSIAAHPLRIPLRTTFRHAAAERSETEALLVEARSPSGRVGFGEGCPRPYVTGETLAGAIAFVEQQAGAFAAAVETLADLRSWAASHAPAIDRNPAAFCALETAAIDLLAREAGCSAEALLGLPELAGSFRYTAVLGDADRAAFAVQLDHYRLAGFRDFKVKLSADAARDRAKLACLRYTLAGDLRLRVDANNLWRRAEDCIAHLRALGHALDAVEEPLQAGDIG